MNSVSWVSLPYDVWRLLIHKYCTLEDLKRLVLCCQLLSRLAVACYLRAPAARVKIFSLSQRKSARFFTDHCWIDIKALPDGRLLVGLSFVTGCFLYAEVLSYNSVGAMTAIS